MSKYLIPILLLLAVTALSARRQCRQHVPYTQNALALSWPGDFCGVPGRCIEAYQKNWDGRSFGIHGLWPSYDSKDLSCVLQGQKPDPYCDYKYNFNGKLLRPLDRKLNTLWPQWGKNNFDSFHKNEWKKHGVCYLKLLKAKYPGRYTDDQLFKSYFQDALALTVGHNRVNKFKFNSKAELARQLRIRDPNTFYVACRAGFIFEVRLCYSISEPLRSRPVRCFLRDLQGEKKKCRFPLQLKQKNAQADE